MFLWVVVILWANIKKKVPFVQAFIEKYFQKDYKIKDM